MARTKKEIRSWLNARVGKRVADKSNAALNGQCVALVKALLEYLGAPNPYKARGNARDVADSYVREKIAKNSDGWLRVVVNRSMASPYGHVWIDLKGEANFEQNGTRALTTTKNTRPFSHRQQVVNLDKYIKAEPAPPKRKAKKGRATVTANVLNVRNSPSKSGKVTATYKKGEKFNYDSYIDTNGYRWLSYVSFGGTRRYVAQRKLTGNKESYIKGGV